MNQSESSTPEKHEGKREEPWEISLQQDDPALLRRAEVRPGKFPGQERIRIVRASRTPLQRVDTGLLKATEASMAPKSVPGLIAYRTKRFLIGNPLSNEQAIHERLTKFKALAVLSSDAISSVAYATELCMGVLLLAGTGALTTLLPITGAIILLLAVVAISYSQTIPAYPNGGGSYIVAKDNLGTYAGLVAAAALLVDYVLTVSVSVTSGVQNLLSIPGLQDFIPYLVEIDVAAIIFITIINLRGIRESGSIFAIPTYFFVFSAFLMIIVGLFRSYVLEGNPFINSFPHVSGVVPLGFFLILRAFASGCSAMTGTEAISNGVPAFKKPEPRNARTTLLMMAAILGSLFAGITLLTMTFGLIPNPSGNPTLI
ncbi:MAG TPA: APC family permease, partial [Ktedonobacteraceae bacterium]|nr:APC family permease [Ktedonobacteraceae bacterium]